MAKAKAPWPLSYPREEHDGRLLCGDQLAQAYDFVVQHYRHKLEDAEDYANDLIAEYRRYPVGLEKLRHFKATRLALAIQTILNDGEIHDPSSSKDGP